VVATVLALSGAGVAGYYLLRPSPPPLPAVDLGSADSEIADAIKQAMDAVRDKPRDGETWGKLGMVLLAHDFDVACVEAFQAAERFDPKNPRWPYLQGLVVVLCDPDAGLACLQRAADKAGTTRSEPRLRLAEVLLDLGHVDDAEAAAAPILERWPSDPRVALIFARIATERGDWTMVLARTEGLQDEPSARRRAAVLRTDALRRLNRVEEAEAAARDAAKLPDDSLWDDRYVIEVKKLKVGGDAALVDGSRLLDGGDIRGAIAVLEQAAMKSKDPNPARLLLAKAYNLAGDPRSARQVVDQVLKSDPNSVEGWFQLGASQFLRGDPGAVASFERAVKLKPDHAQGYHNLGLARKKQGDRAGAAIAFEAALRCRPDYAAPRQALDELRKGK
jgi:tetratricopeptide (TPR) repeat protein